MNFFLSVTDVISFSVGIFIPNYKTAFASDYSANKTSLHKVHHNKVNFNCYKTCLNNFSIIVNQCLRISNSQDFRTTYLTLNQKQSNDELITYPKGTPFEKRSDNIFLSNNPKKDNCTNINTNLAQTTQPSNSKNLIKNIPSLFGIHPYFNAQITF